MNLKPIKWLYISLGLVGMLLAHEVQKREIDEAIEEKLAQREIKAGLEMPDLD